MAWPSFRQNSALGAAIRVAVLFSAFSILWIALTDRILGWLVRDPELLIRLATTKGMVYVVLMGLLVFWFTYSALVDTGASASPELKPHSFEETKPLGLWAPLTIFGISSFLVGLVGYQAFRFQGIAIAHGRGSAASELARMAWISAALGILFLALAGILLMLWWKREQMRVRAIHTHLDQERLSLKQKFELLSQYTNDIVLILDDQRRIVGANDRAAEAYGYDHEELLALTVDELRGAEGAAELPEQYMRALSDGSLKFETIHRRKDGSSLPVEVSARRFEQNGRSFIQSVVRDITERREAQRALQESERQFRSIFEQADVGMVEYSPEGHFLRTNPKFCEFLRYNEGELLALTFMDVTHPAHREEDARELGRLLIGERTGYRTVKQYCRKDGVFVWGRTSVSLLLQSNADSKRFIAVIQDINVWRHTEEKLQERETLLQRILDTTPNLIYIYDLIEKRLVFITRKVFDIIGRTPDEMLALGQSIFERLAHPGDLDRIAQHRERLVSARYPDAFELEYRMQHSNGQWRWVRNRDVLFARLKDGTPSQILGTTEDITERKHAEEALRESEHFLQEAQKAGGIGTYSWDIMKNVWTSSEELNAIFGIEDSYPKKINSWTEIVAPQWRQRMTEYVQEILEHHRPFDLEYQILRPSDGSLRWVHGKGDILRDASGNPLRMWGVIQDITQRKRDEESLQRLATLLNRSQAITHVGGYESDLKTAITFWSEEMFQIHELPVGGIVPTQEMTLSMYVPECQSTIREAVQRLVEHGDGYDLELEKITAKGHRIWVRNIAEAILEDGQTVKIVGALQDITERRQVQAALQEQRHRLFDIIEATRIGTWEWQVQTGALVLNERWAEITGRTLAELEPIDIRTFTELVDPGDLEDSNTLLDQHFKGQSPYYECEFRMRHRDGFWVWVLDRGKVVQWTEAGEPLRMSGTLTDITERKVVEEQVRRMNEDLEQRVQDRTAQLDEMLKAQTQVAEELERSERALYQKMAELEAANRELEAFSYSVSHDLRAPLRGIDGFSQALVEDFGGCLDDEARQYLQRIRAGTRRMGQIIDDLLQLSKVSRGELNIQPTDLTAIARQVSSTLTLAHPGRSVEVLLEDDLVAHADSHQIQMVIENLLGNAWKYTALRQDARIEFGQLHINDQSVFFVRDNGVGFQMDYSEKLFEPFQRLHSAPEFEGSGIGLAIVQRIILRHGGRIWGEGEPGQGATFYFSLPD